MKKEKKKKFSSLPEKCFGLLVEDSVSFSTFLYTVSVEMFGIAPSLSIYFFKGLYSFLFSFMY